MTNEELIQALDRLKVQTGSLACLGCGYEHNCTTKGCRILREAAEQLCRRSCPEKRGRMKIERNSSSDGAILICAVRYALGRMTYMPELVMGAIAPLAPEISDNDLLVMRRDVKEWLQRNDKTKAAYYSEWESFSARLEEETRKRWMKED